MLRSPRGAWRCLAAAVSFAVSSSSAAPFQSSIEAHDANTITVRLVFPSPVVESFSANGETFADVSMPEWDATTELGWPRVPRAFATFGIPADRTVSSVRLEPLRVERVATSAVRPVMPESRDLAETMLANPPWVDEPSAPYPAEASTLAGVSWWRNRRVARVALYPVRTVPGERGIDVVREARLVLTLAPQRIASAKSLRAEFGDDPWDEDMDRFLVNGPESREWLRSEAPLSTRRGASDYFSRSLRWARIETEGEGLTRVTGSQLAALGLPLPITDPSSLRLFVGSTLELPETPPVFDPGVFDWMNEVSIVVEDGGDGALDATTGDRVEFFAVPVEGYIGDLDPARAAADTTLRFSYYTNHYTARRVYWLTWDGTFSGTPRRMDVESVTPAGAADTTFATVPRRIHVERNSWYDPNQSSGESQPRIWERWWWNLGFGRGEGAIVVNFDLPGHVPLSAGAFIARFWGVTDNFVGSLPDHLVNLSCNGNVLPRVGWNGKQRYDLLATWPEGGTHLQETRNRFLVTVDPEADPACPPPNCTRLDKVYLAWFEVWDEYALTWKQQDLVFRSPPVGGRVRYRIADVPDAATEVYDVTDPAHPVKLAGGVIAGTTLELDRIESPSVSRRYVVTHPSVRKAPSELRRHVAPGAQYLRERTGPVDYIIIHHEDFAAAAQELRELRDAYTPGVTDPVVLTVPVESIFDEFSFGMRDPTAIRDFLKFAYENYRDSGAPTSPRLRYATLIGDASFDHRSRVLSVSQDFVPAWSNRYERSLWDQGYLASWPADDYFALFDGRDTSTLYLAVGRLPAQTAAQALEMVRKTRDHTLSPDPGPWRSRVTMVADDICQGVCYDSSFYFTHIWQAETSLIPAIPPEMDFRRIYLTEFPDPVTGLKCRAADKPSARNALIDSINEGCWLVDYVGHGGATQMADEKVLLSSDVPAMQNAGRYHYFMTASCSVGKFDETAEGLGETVLKAVDGGAVVSISASAVAGSAENVALNRETLRALFRSGSTHPDSIRTIGEAVVLARAIRGGLGGFELNDTKYNILGDPAVSLAWSDHAAHALLSVSGEPTFVDRDTLWRGETMAVQGMVMNPDGSEATTFSGTADIAVFDSEELRHREPYRDFDACDGTSVQVFPRDYFLGGAPIYRASVPVTAGRFESEFLVPLGLRRGARGDARIRCLVSNDGASSAALSTIEDIVVPDNPRPGWSSDDTEGPSIEIGFDGPPLAVPFGSNVHVSFEDASGINITQLLDSRSVILTFEEPGGFVAALVDLSTELAFGEDFTRASIDVAVPTSLDAGRPYTVRVRASDNLGNRGQSSEDIFLVSSTNPELQRVFAYPNPSNGQSVGIFVDLNVPADVTAKIYTVAGKLIRTLDASLAAGEGRSRPLVWNLQDEDGDGVANGSYLYVMEVAPRAGGKTERREGWIAVLR